MSSSRRALVRWWSRAPGISWLGAPAIKLLADANVDVAPLVLHRLGIHRIGERQAAQHIAGGEEVELRPAVDGRHEVEIAAAQELFVAVDLSLRKLHAREKALESLVRRCQAHRFGEVSSRQRNVFGHRRRNPVEPGALAREPYVRERDVRRRLGVAWVFQIRGRQGLDHAGESLVATAMQRVPDPVVGALRWAVGLSRGYLIRGEPYGDRGAL